MDFQIAELPGHVNYFTPDFNQANIFAEIGAVIWVIDAQDQYLDALNQLIDTITYLAQTWPAINVEVFVHKVDGLSEEYKNDTFRDIRQRILDELSDLGYDNAPVSFYQTSIYDHSVFESISKVIQKLLPQLPTLESLLNSLCSTCRIQKAYLFDIITKIYIASDTSPQDTNSYEICSDLIDVVVDIGELYGWPRGKDDQTEKLEFGNHACESMVTMEKKGHNYLYLREMNRCVDSAHAQYMLSSNSHVTGIWLWFASWAMTILWRRKSSSTTMLVYSKRLSQRCSNGEKRRVDWQLGVVMGKDNLNYFARRSAP